MNLILVPKSITLGGGSLKEVTNLLKSLGKNKPFIITDNNMVKLGIIKPLENYLNDFEIKYKIFKDTIPEPTSQSILKAVEILKEGSFDSIIAFGGGSPIDSAKAISALAWVVEIFQTTNFLISLTKRLFNYRSTYYSRNRSEVTKFTIITDEKTDEKMLC